VTGPPETTSADTPLDGVRVLDLTRLLPGGFCSQWLADFGAEVIKVEDTGAGDYIRFAPPYYEAAPGEDEESIASTRSALYLSLNRSKRSVRIDLKSDAGREAFLRLVETADVLLEGFRPGVMDRLGVGFETLTAVNPGLVYCAITGYGQDGPNRDRAGHDLNYLGSTGLLDITGQKDGPPIQPGAQIGDLGGGAMTAAFGVMAALFSKERTGKGQMVDISMTDGAMSWLAMVAGAHFADGDVPVRGEVLLAGAVACYLPYEAADGWVSCGALEPKFWQAFCAGVDLPELAENQFDPPGSAGWEKIAGVFRSRTRAQWKQFNDEHNCCIEPILNVEEALGSDLARERGMVVEIDQPGIGKVRQVGNPVKLSGTPAREPGPAPAAGADTVAVLAEAGMDQQEIGELLESGAVAGPGGGSSEGIGFRA
jgi:crotonobetainyl-CoA:carnitine CoA-transferase CaiB-like acyl-CoA transferase